ncbi:MAG: T9SS type A sorting domain-containing protein, partial [Bacteroidota bacterium]
MSDSISGSTSYTYWHYTQGLVYWNESMPSIQQDKMNPDTLDAHHQLAGWVQDTMIYYQGASALAYYRACSLTGMPTMTIDDNNYLFLTWTSPTVLMDPSSFMLRHIFGRTAQIESNTNAIWNETIHDMNQDFLYNFSECVWPSMAQKSSATQFFFEFMADDLAGAFLNTAPGVAGQSSITDNFITVMKVDKSSVGVGINDQKKDVASLMVSRNYPNPVSGTTSIGIQTNKAGNLSIDVTNLTGQKVISLNKGYASAGAYRYSVDCSQLSAGVYFYTVTVGNESRTQKMIVE